MTQDKCIYTISVHSMDSAVEAREYMCESNSTELDVSILSEDPLEEDAVKFTVEVLGDAYSIPVFEEGLTEISDVEVENADVNVGEGKR